MSKDYKDVAFETVKNGNEGEKWNRPSVGINRPYSGDDSLSGSGAGAGAEPAESAEPVRTAEPEKDADGHARPVEYRSSMKTDTNFVGGSGADGEKKTHELAYYFCKGKRSSEPGESIVRQCATGKGFNWAAFLFGYIYLLYRRCYVECLVLILAAFSITSFIEAGSALTIAVSVALGFIFPWLYKNKMEKKYNAAIAAGQDPIERLREDGGVSIPAMIVGIVILVVLIILNLMVLTGGTGNPF